MGTLFVVFQRFHETRFVDTLLTAGHDGERVRFITNQAFVPYRVVSEVSAARCCSRTFCHFHISVMVILGNLQGLLLHTPFLLVQSKV